MFSKKLLFDGIKYRTYGENILLSIFLNNNKGFGGTKKRQVIQKNDLSSQFSLAGFGPTTH